MVNTAQESQSPDDKQENDMTMQDISQIVEKVDDTEQKKSELLAQLDELESSSQLLDDDAPWAEQLNELSADHLLSREFNKDVTDPKLAKLYRRAYEFHMAEAARYKEILGDIAKSLTTELDRPKAKIDPDMIQFMKGSLQKKKDNL